MAFITYENIRHIIPPGVAKELENPATFDSVEAEAGKLVTEITSIDSPADVDDAPSWVVQPMAFIITKLLSIKLQTASAETLDRIEKDYNWAVEFLNGKKAQGAATETSWSATGTFANLTEI